MLFRQIFDEDLAQYAYLIGCQRTGEALLVDPQRDIDRYLDIAAGEGLRITAVTETHIHADFLSGARELAEHDPSIRVYLSDEGDADWKYAWSKDDRYRVTDLKDGTTFSVGNIELKAIHTPGHTPEHVAFLVTDHGGGANTPMGMLSGDFVFVGDLGRPDLLETAAGVAGAREPAAQRLYATAQAFLDLPDHLQIWPAHGAGSACGKALGAVPQSTVGYEKRFSPAFVAAGKSEQEFVTFILSGQPEPPLYFARMKQLNKTGAPVLGQLPRPRQVSVEDFAKLAAEPEAFVIDTRTDRDAFMSGHVARSLFAPLDRSFSAIVGSYLLPERPIHLIVAPEGVDRAVRNLVRIGFDRIESTLAPEEISALPNLRSTPVDDFAAVASAGSDACVLDVRRETEFAEGSVPGAINVAHTRLRARLDEVPRGKKVLVHCRSGARAAAASAFLEREGYDVTLIAAPFTQWAQFGSRGQEVGS